MSLNESIVNYKLFLEKKNMGEALITEKSTAVGKAQNELEETKANLCKSIFEPFTIQELKDIWNKVTEYERYEIIEYVPEIKWQIEKLAGHGGLNEGEIEEDIIQSEWNESEWLTPMSEYFEKYCRHSQECEDYNAKHESDTRGECICDED